MIIILGIIVHFALGFLTQYLMFLKCRVALGYNIKFFIHEKYDILDKNSSDPKSNKLHGIVVICNGSISFLIYFIGQLYWTGFKTLKFLYLKYVAKQKFEQWKYHCIISKHMFKSRSDEHYRRVLQSELSNDPFLAPLIGYSHPIRIDWTTAIQFDAENNIFFNGKKCNSHELYLYIQEIVQRYNSHIPIESFEDL